MILRNQEHVEKATQVKLPWWLQRSPQRTRLNPLSFVDSRLNYNRKLWEHRVGSNSRHAKIENLIKGRRRWVQRERRCLHELRKFGQYKSDVAP